MTDIPKHWKGPAPIPDIEVYARPTGSIQLMCPDCGYLNSRFYQFWRLAYIQCANPECQHKFRIGVGLTDAEGSYRAMLMGKFTGNVVNKLNPDTHYPLTGRVFGAFAYECPKCTLAQETSIPFASGLIRCKGCKYEYFVQLLVYRPSGPRNITPYDFTVVLPYAQQTTLQSIPAPQTDSYTRTTSESTGNNSENSNQ